MYCACSNLIDGGVTLKKVLPTQSSVAQHIAAYDNKVIPVLTDTASSVHNP